MDKGGPPLASLSLTQVHYNPSDPLSHVCAWLALVPHGLLIVYATLIWSTREIEIALTFAGQMACEALNWGLKRYFKQARPEAIRHLGKGYGMPSSHAQFLGYFAVSVTLFLLFRHAPSTKGVERIATNGSLARSSRGRRKGEDSNKSIMNGTERSLSSGQDADSEAEPQISEAYKLQLHYPRLTHTILSVATIILAAAVTVSRVYLNYHTVEQVLVGCSAGALFSVAWFSATEFARRTGLVEWVLDWEIVRKARIRDLICEDDLVEIGWQVWEGKRKRGKVKKKAR